MFRRLLGKLLGDFPPKGLHLCDKCQIAYTVAGVIHPPITLDELVELLYQYGMLCDKPCGTVNRHLLPQQHSAISELPEIFQKSGINCQNCTVSFIILSIFAQTERDVTRAATDLQRKHLICNQCLHVFVENIDKITLEVLSAIKGADYVRDVITGKRN